MRPEIDITRECICSICHSQDIDIFFEIEQVPVYCNIFCPTRNEALHISRGDIQLGFCKQCGYISNLVFSPELIKYSQNYENSLFFSPRFQDYAQTLARRLIEKYKLYGKDVIEIGCGQGEFLAFLCELGNNRGVGFDRSYRRERSSYTPSNRMTFVQDSYSERYAHYQAELICCRHVLEHIAQPTDFLGTVRRAIEKRRDTIVFFEVPNVLFTLRDLAIWDIIYEHCSYFSSHSLARLFTTCGFEVCDLVEAYDGQFLCIEALPGEGFISSHRARLVTPQDLADDVAAFAECYRHKQEAWQCHLEQIEQRGQRSVLWGAGSKGVTFLNMLGIRDQIEYVVDINPRKQGMYIAGTGQGIVPPEFLRDYRPDVVLVMNPIYRHEVKHIIERIGISVEIMTL